MSTCIFYDPTRRHQLSPIDPDFMFIRDRNDLRIQVLANDHLQKVLCFCCPDASLQYREFLQYPQLVSIYLCKEHYGPEKDLIFHPKVKDDIVFNTNNEWEYQCRLDLYTTCGTCGNRSQAMEESKKLLRMKKPILITSISIEAIDLQEDTLNKSSICEEAR